MRIIAAHKRGLSIEQAINQAVKERLSRSLLADLHASYRTIVDLNPTVPR